MRYKDEHEKSEFKKNFWIAFIITLTSTLFYCAGPLACIIIWIVYLVKKKEGAYGWLVGMFAALAIFILAFGGCLVIFFS